jgi:hypothetical protein
MPEDIKELYLQRQHEMREEQSNFLSAASKGTTDGDKTTPAAVSDPTLEKITLPPPPGEGLNVSKPADSGKSEPAAPHVAPHDDAPPPPAATRPREVEPNKKKGKKGNDDQ